MRADERPTAFLELESATAPIDEVNVMLLNKFQRKGHRRLSAQTIEVLVNACQCVMIYASYCGASFLRSTRQSRGSVLRLDAEWGINQVLMKRLLLLFIMPAACACSVLASDSLPFPVSVGGQAAKDGTPFAKIEKPVAADAELSVESKDGLIIVNVHPVNAKNEPVPDSTPAVILLQGKTKTNLDKTMDGKKLAAGIYVMSVVSEGKTASILLTIK